MFVKDIVKNIEVSDIRKINEKIIKIPNSINLTIGEPDLDVPKVIREAVAYHSLNSKIKYSPIGGMAELREKIAKFYNNKFNGNYNLDNVIVTVGSTEGLSSTLKTILNTGDEVLIPTPAYVGYEPLIKFCDAIPKFIDLEDNNFKLTVEKLEENINKKTKLIILTYPNNPSGMILEENEMIKIINLLKKKNIYLISDEIYSSIIFNKNYTSFAKYYNDLEEKLIIINGFSKSHSMTGYRIGYVLVNEKLQKEIKKVSQYSVTSSSTLSQYAGIIALDKCSNTENISKIYKKRAKFFSDEINKLGFRPLKAEGAFYIFASYKNIKKLNEVNSLDFVMDLLEKTGVGIVPGSTFKAEGYVRFSLVQDIPILKEALNRIKKYINEL